MTDISFHVGEDVKLLVTMDPVVDITGWTISFTLRKEVGVLPVAVNKTGAPDITIVNGPGGLFQVKVNSADTASLTPGEYSYDIQRLDSGSRTVLVEGIATLLVMVNPVTA